MIRKTAILRISIVPQSLKAEIEPVESERDKRFAGQAGSGGVKSFP
jgi:hypothetical protein